MRDLWRRIVLVVGLRYARASISLAMWLARFGDRLGSRVLKYVHRPELREREPERDQVVDPDKTPNDRPPCPGCGRPGGTGHEPNCAIV